MAVINLAVYIWLMCVFQVKELLWNSDSAVLAVWLEDMTAGEDGQVNTYSKFSQSLTAV